MDGKRDGRGNRNSCLSPYYFPVKQEGIAGVPVEVRDKLSEIIELSKLNGLFVVPVGELEKWIDLGTSQKNKWIIPALEILFEDKCPVALRTFIANVIERLKTS